MDSRFEKGVVDSLFSEASPEPFGELAPEASRLLCSHLQHGCLEGYAAPILWVRIAVYGLLVEVASELLTFLPKD